MEAAINGYGSILRTVKNEAESVAGNAPVNYPEEYNMIRLEWWVSVLRILLLY